MFRARWNKVKSFFSSSKTTHQNRKSQPPLTVLIDLEKQEEEEEEVENLSGLEEVEDLEDVKDVEDVREDLEEEKETWYETKAEEKEEEYFIEHDVLNEEPAPFSVRSWKEVEYAHCIVHPRTVIGPLYKTTHLFHPERWRMAVRYLFFVAGKYNLCVRTTHLAVCFFGRSIVSPFVTQLFKSMKQSKKTWEDMIVACLLLGCAITESLSNLHIETIFSFTETSQKDVVYWMFCLLEHDINAGTFHLSTPLFYIHRFAELTGLSWQRQKFVFPIALMAVRFVMASPTFFESTHAQMGADAWCIALNEHESQGFMVRVKTLYSDIKVRQHNTKTISQDDLSLLPWKHSLTSQDDMALLPLKHRPRTSNKLTRLNAFILTPYPFKVEVAEDLGRGVEGRVCKARFDHDQKRTFATKIVPLSTLLFDQIYYICRKLVFFNTVTPHPNVLRPFSSGKVSRTKERKSRKIPEIYSAAALPTSPHYIECMPRMEQDLCMYMRERKSMTFSFTQTIAKSILSALAHLHRFGFVHRDVKPSNILLGSDKNDVRLADFGLSTQMLHSDDDEFGKRNAIECQTLWWRAPEVLVQSEYSSKCDVWSVGVILFECLTGQKLVAKNSSIEQFHGLLRLLGISFPSFSSSLQNMTSTQKGICWLIRELEPLCRLDRVAFQERFARKPSRCQSELWMFGESDKFEENCLPTHQDIVPLARYYHEMFTALQTQQMSAVEPVTKQEAIQKREAFLRILLPDALKDVMHIQRSPWMDDCLNLLSQMLELNPEWRPSADECLKHPFFTHTSFV